MKPSASSLRTFAGLRRLVATLRGPGGCPWDRAQTAATLRPYLLEESSEALAALDEGEADRVCEELGDLIFQVLIQTQLAEEAGNFTMEDVLHGIGSKLVRRHPHVFGQAVAETPDEVIDQWDELKRRERSDQSALTGIPPTLPALAYAQAVQRRAAKAGFTFESEEQAWTAFEEELDELRLARTPQEKRGEMGDALFALANVARWQEVDAEDALRQTSRTFTGRFQRLEALVKHRGVDLSAAEIQQKLALWEEAKGLAK